MGDADHVPSVLKDAGVEEIFHKIQMRPGKPLWFGRRPEGQVVFALPGNPLSVQISLRLFAEQFFRKCFGMSPSAGMYLPFEGQRKKKVKLDEFFPCKLVTGVSSRIGPVSFNGSGDISAMVRSDGFAWHKIDQNDLYPGDIVNFFPW